MTRLGLLRVISAVFWAMFIISALYGLYAFGATHGDWSAWLLPIGLLCLLVYLAVRPTRDR